jgi:hypothetical protein
MAKRKTSKNTNTEKAKSAKKAAHTKATSHSSSRPQSAAVAIATRTLAVLPPISDHARAAFLGQTTPQERAVLGGRTKAIDVLACAGQWIAIIKPALDRDRSRNSIRYPTGRLAFLCEETLALADAINHARAGQSGSSKAAARINATRATARHLRGELIHALQSITRGTADAAEVAAIERRDTDTDLVGALSDLAALAQGWLDRAAREPEVAPLVDGVLMASDVAAATSAAVALGAAGMDKSDAGRAGGKDPPAVNLVEGTVTAELRVVYRAFEKAHALDGNVPRLVATGSLHAIFGSHAKKTPATPPAPQAPPAKNAPATAAS